MTSVRIQVNNTAFVAACVMAAGWAISIEMRLDREEDVNSLRGRVGNIEELICEIRNLSKEGVKKWYCLNLPTLQSH